MTVLRPHERRQGGLVLRFRIERGQPFRLGGAEQALVGRDEDEVVAARTQVLASALFARL